MSTTTVKPAETRDLDADLAICEAATQGPWQVGYRDVWTGDSVDQIATNISSDNVRFIAEARQGWPYAIRLVKSQREEIDRLRAERDALEDKVDRLVEELRMERDRQQYRSGCYD